MIMVLVAVPVDSIGGAPSIHNFVLTFHSPAIDARTLCGAPGVMAFIMAAMYARSCDEAAWPAGGSWAKACDAHAERRQESNAAVRNERGVCIRDSLRVAEVEEVSMLLHHSPTALGTPKRR